MSTLQPVRGTDDILPDVKRAHRRVEEEARAVAARYGYAEVATPILEFTEVFARTLGDTSDIVTKEMYTFVDRGGDSLTLRPENTAGVARAFISNGLHHDLPLKVFYSGPMFRREHSQLGRRRQFHQVGVELLGVAEPLADVEVIAMAAGLIDALGLADRVVCEINTLGDGASRDAYRETLVAYLSAPEVKGRLSPDSLERLDRNPLRILDSKDDRDREVVAAAPQMGDSLNAESRDYFDAVLAGLEAAGVAFRRNPHLVRGLDYYCHTAFEFTTDALGAQGTVLAGGRYDGLIAQMGGPATPGTGWAAGIERLAMLIAPPPAPRPIAVVPVGADQAMDALVWTQRLRHAGFAVDLGFSGNLKKRLKRANKINACAAVLLGEDELARGQARVRDLDSGDQTDVALDGLEAHLARYNVDDHG